MKVFMSEWVSGIKNLPEWFKHGQETEVSMEQILELFKTGNNVMLAHYGTDGMEMLLAVDNKRFTQR